MCGIVGYIGKQDAVPVLLKGLERLEYRGYDSAGLAVVVNDELIIRKARGRLSNLQERIEQQPVSGPIGLGHTRWATHGEPSDINSHPQTDVAGRIAVVHNGIIENYFELKQWLIKEKGIEFSSQTDTEVIAHLLNVYYEGNMLDALVRVLALLKGSYALGILCLDEPDNIYCVRKESPLVCAVCEHGGLLASDISVMIEYTRDVYLLENMELARISRHGIEFFNAFGDPVHKDFFHVDWDITAAERGGYQHFMLKEIHEQPEALTKTLRPLVDDSSDQLMLRPDLMPLTKSEVKQIEQIFIVACGTAYHAGVVGKSVLEKLTRLPVEVDIASEFRYRDPIIKPNTLVIVISQSGETADTLAALREAKARNCPVLAITNVVGSSVARDADKVLYTWAGPEIAVASTKAYVTQIMLLNVLAIDFAQKIGKMDATAVDFMLRRLLELPDHVKWLLGQEAMIARFANRHFDKKSVFFIGRGLDHSVAIEGSLKLKEISYIHSEAYAAGELKHGTIALIEPGTLVVALATQEHVVEKTLANVQEVAVRGAYVLTIAKQGDHRPQQAGDVTWQIPPVDDLFTPILSIIPIQLLSYYVALEKGCDIDKPRNLAKSVTVE